MNLHRAVVVWILLAIAASAASALRLIASEPLAANAKADSTALPFRRIYLPEDRLDQWPRGDVRYLPQDAAEFERMVDRLQHASRVLAPPVAEIARTTYSAQLAGDSLIDGEASFEVHSLSSSPTLLRLDPCRLAIQSPHWSPSIAPPSDPAHPSNVISSNGNSQTKSTANPSVSNTQNATQLAPNKSSEALRNETMQIGTLGVGSDGVLSLRLAGSGTLHFGWTLRGRQETAGTLAFPLQLPPSPSIQLRLQLPAELVPSVDQGFVTLLPLAAAASTATTSTVTPSRSVDPSGMRTWQIDLGGQNQAVLHLSPRDLLHEHRPLTLVRQSLTYDISPHGLQLSAELKLDVLGEPVRQLTLLLDRPLDLVTARCGDVQIPWADVDSPDAKAPSIALHNNSRRVVLNFPEPLVGRGRIVRLGAVAPLPARARLPALRPAPDDAFWQEGSASLLISLPLELNELRVQGARQTKTEPLAAPLAGEAITLQYFRPDADINVAIAPQPDELQFRSCTTVDVRGGTMTGRYLADISATQGECFELEADLAPSWIVDSVESLPAGAIAGWNRAGSNGGAAGQLQISLSKSIRPDRPLQLVITGRWRRAPLGERLHRDDLQMVSLLHLKGIRSMAVIRPAAAFRCQFTGADSLHRLDLNHLDAVDSALIGDKAGGLGMVLDDFAAGLAIVLESETPRFSGEVHLDIQVEDRSLTESYTFHCTPESAEVDRLLIHFSRARSEPLHWQLLRSAARPSSKTPSVAVSLQASSATVPNKVGSDATATKGARSDNLSEDAQSSETTQPLSIRRLSAAEQASAGLAAVGEVWELRLRQPQNTPLTIAATRTTPLVEETPVSLGWLVQAVAQSGTVAVKSSGELFPTIINRRLKPIPAEPPPLDGWPNQLAAYQYEPQDEIVSAAADPAASLSITPGTQSSAAWAWSCRLDSHYSSDHVAEHLICLRIENTGRSRLNFQLPTGGQLNAAWIDDAPALVANSTKKQNHVAGEDAAKTSALSGSSIQLELPHGRRFVVVALHWTSKEQPLSMFASCTAELPEFDLPILARQWFVWLPPRYRLANSTIDDGFATGQVSWSQRVFGPFGRPLGESAFDPVKASSWLALVRRIAGRDAAWNQAEQLLQLASRPQAEETSVNDAPGSDAVAKRLSSGSASSESAVTTWGELLTQTQSELAHQAGDGSTVPLLIDAAALASVGLSPRSLIQISASGATNPAGWPLVQSDLVLLVHPRALLLTTRSAAAASAEPWSAPNNGVLRRVVALGLAEKLSAAATTDGSDLFPSVQVWTSREAKSPWPPVGERAAIDRAGWVVYRFDLPDVSLPRIWVVRADAMLALGCSLFLLVTMLVWWKGTTSWQSKGVAMSIATAVALLLPSVCTPLGAGLWLGLACGWMLRGLSRRHNLAPMTRNTSPLSGVGSAMNVVSSALLLSLLAAGSLAKAAESAPAVSAGSIADAYAVPEVLIPSDDQQRLKGKNYLVPESLYNDLAHRVAQLNPPTTEWLITSAAYRGGLTHSSTSGTTDTLDWSASYELEVFTPAARVRIPFGGLGTNLLPDGVRLDGHPIQFRWTGGRELELDLFEAGHHVLQLAFRPTPVTTAAATTIDFAVLPVATARVELIVPVGLDVEISSARAALTLDRQTGRLTGLLGPTDRVTVRSTESSGHAVAAAVADVDELFWLHVRPGSVVLETRFNFRVVNGKLNEIHLRADPRLRRLPSADASIAQVRTEQGEPQTIYLGLDQPATDQVSLKLSFLLTDTTGIGNLRLPRLEAVGVRSATRRLAVSVESPLEYEEPAAGLWQSSSAEQFLAGWGGADISPQLVYQLPLSVDNWHLAIHSRQPQIASVDQLVATIEHGRLAAKWSADLSIHDGVVFQLHLPLSPQFTVEGVQLRQGGAADRPIRWARTENGVTLFLPGPGADHAKLLLQGGMPFQPGITQLPRLRIDSSRVDSQTILILRGANLKVSLANAAGLKPASEGDVQLAIERAKKDGLVDNRAIERDRLIFCLAGKPSGDVLPTLNVESNTPHVKAIEKISVDRADDAWTAVVDLDLDVSGGFVDVLRFEIPAQWSSLTQTVPEMPFEIVDIPGENRRHMILRPKTPISGASRLTLKGPIAVNSQRVRVPDIRPLGLGSVRRFVLLPTHSNEQQLVWETRGLNVEPLPARFASTSPQLEIYRTCQVIGETFEATLKSVEKTVGQPHVRLADIAVTALDGQHGYGTAAFDLEPAGSTNCVLELAENTRLVYVRVNGLPAAVHPVSQSQSPLSLNVSLTSGKLPQHIEVVFQCEWPAELPGATERRLPAPVLVRTPVEATLWTLAGSVGRESAEATNAVALSPLQRDLDRLESSWQLLNSAAAVLTEEPPETTSAWYTPWARRLLIDRNIIQRQRGHNATAEVAETIDAQTRTIDEQGARLAHRIGTWNLLTELSTARPAPEGMMQLWQSTDSVNQSAAGYYIHGFSPALSLMVPRAAATVWSLRLLMSVAGASFVGLLFWIGSHRSMHFLTTRWPHWTGVVVGLLWWLALSPSLLGWVIVAASVLGAFWPGFGKRPHTA